MGRCGRKGMVAYDNLCPGCGGRATDVELSEHGLCGKCLERGECNSLGWLCDVRKGVSELEQLFEKNVGKMNLLQKSWAARFFLGLSFPLSAPTGTGKTTFALMLSAYLSMRDERSYLIFPTRALVSQARERLEEFGCRDVASYPGDSKERIFSGDFLVLVTTSAFFHRNFERLELGYALVFVDDVDSFMKSARNVERLLSVAQGSRIVMSSATARPRPAASRLLVERIGMKPPRNFHPVRNVIDCRAGWEWKGMEKDYDRLAGMVTELRKSGKAGIVFVSSRMAVDEAVEQLSGRGIGALPYHKLEEFRRSGDVIVGIAHPLNPLVRGIDMPERIGFAIFTHVPRFEIPVDGITHKNARVVASVISREFPELWKLRGDALVRRISEIVERESDRLESIPDISISNGRVVMADVATYLQASGRVSRLRGRKLEAGLSVVVPDDEKAMAFLERRLKWMNGIEFRNGWKEWAGEIGKGREIRPRHLLVVVESPTKAKTIASFFSKPGMVLDDGVSEMLAGYMDVSIGMVATRGHVTDLSTSGLFGVEGTVPVFTIIDGKEGMVDVLRKLSLFSDVLIATDPDREGEKIAYDIFNSLKHFSHSISRAEFHEVTRKAFLSSIASPRGLDMKRVGAQLVRRIADRWIGFSSSLDIQQSMGRKTLSAGRVQTPVLGWIIDAWKRSRETEIVAEFSIPAGYVAIRFSIPVQQGKGRAVAKARVTVSKREEVLGKEPMDTEAMLRLASGLFPPERTMSIAQSLFEKGLITYHRTDSRRVSDAGMDVARDFIAREFGVQYFRPNRGKGEGAHECIRPTRPFPPGEAASLFSLSREEYLLYSMIFRHFMASQMKPVRVEMSRVVAEVEGVGKAEKEVFSGILEHGWDLAVPIRVVEGIREGIVEVEVSYRRKRKAYPLTYAEIVSMMKQRGIGRPSTYALTIGKLKERKYVIEVGKSRKFIVPTKLGIAVYNMLMDSRWKGWLSEEYTAELEAVMDKVEKGDVEWHEVVERLGREIFGDRRKS